MITNLEPDIQECEVNWALESITMNKASGGDGIPTELFQTLKDDAVKVLHSIYASKFGKLSSGHRTGKGQFSFQSQRKAISKNAETTAQLHSSHNASKVMLKIIQARLQQYVNCELADVLAGFRKGRGTRDQIANIRWIIEKQGNSRKTSTSVSLTTLKPLTVWITTLCGKFLELGIPDLLTYLLRNLYVGQEATVRARHGTMDWFQIGKGVG